MKEKLTITKIQELLYPYLSNEDLKDQVIDWFGANEEDLNLAENDSEQSSKDIIWKQFNNSYNWLSDSIDGIIVGRYWNAYIEKRRNNYKFTNDFLNYSNNCLIEEIKNKDISIFKKCIKREFYPDNDLGDAFRLEVLTTPDDTEIVGWVIFVD